MKTETNTQPKHTQGEWIFFNTFSGYWIKDSTNRGDNIICCLNHPNGEPYGDRESNEIEANAKLIASAPEMLDELKATDTYINDVLSKIFSGQYKDVNQLIRPLETIFNNCRKTAQKATE